MKPNKTYKIFILLIIFIISCSPSGNIRKRSIRFSEDKRDKIIETAKRYLGTKYLYGGTTSKGFDCSGFSMFVYKQNGLSIPRSVSSQYYSGKRISLKFAEPGDLIFFAIRGNRISHVGIYTGNYNFIHSPSSGKKVSYASIKNPYWSKRYVKAITYFSKIR